MTDTTAPSGDSTPAKHRNLKPPWQPGQSGNPNGRDKGSRNKLAEKFIDDIYAKWQEHGTQAIQSMIVDRPGDFVKVVAGLLPQDVNVTVNQFDNMSEDELIARIRALDAIVRPFLDGPAGSHAANGRGNGSAQAQTVN